MPAALWRGGAAYRGVIAGACLGLFFGVLAWLDAGMVAAGVAVLVVLGVGCGVWIPLRAARYWPGAQELTGTQRSAVVTAARRGQRIDDVTLAPAVGDYARGVRAAARTRRIARPVVVMLLVVAVAMAFWDAIAGSVGNAVVSLVYLVLLLLELFWWPRRVAELLDKVNRAAALARPTEISD